MIRKLAIAVLLALAPAVAKAQVCPAGSTCTPMETYLYGQGPASAPYGSGLKFPVIPSGSANSALNVGGNLLMDLSSTQTATNKTFTSPSLTGPTLTGTITLGGITGSTQCLQVNSSGVVSGTGAVCGGGGGGGTGTAPQAAYFSATNTVTGNTNVSYLTGYTQLNYMTSLGSVPTPLAGTVLQLSGADTTNARVQLNSFGGISKYDVACFGGTGASKTAVGSGATCGGYDVFAYDGANLIGPLGGLSFVTAQAQSVGAGGMNTILSSTPNGATAPVNRIQINQDGGIMVPPGVTGGSQGPGTINMAGCFVNGVACAAGSSTSFTSLTSGTNTVATMLVGTGSSLAASGSGTLTATAMPATGLTGTMNAAQLPAFTGDVTSPSGSSVNTIAANAVTNAKAAQATANTVKGNFTGSTANVSDNPVPSCNTSNHFLQYTSGAGLGCGTSSGGATALWTGTATGTGTYTSTTVQGGFTSAAYNMFCGVFASSNTGAATLNLDGNGAVAINVQSPTGLLPLSGGEIPAGTSICLQENSTPVWVKQPFGPHITRNPTSPHTVTVSEWVNNETFIFDGSSSGSTLVFQSGSLYSAQGGINVGSALVVPTLTPASTDGFNGGTINTSVFLSPDTVTFVTGTGATGGNAFQVPVGKPELIDVSWVPGMNLSAASQTIRSTRGGAHVVTSIKCTPDVLVGGTATIEFRYAPSGTAIGSGTLISASAAFNANTGANTEQVLTLLGSATSIPIPGGNRIGYVAAGGGWASPTSGAGGCTLTVF